MSQFVTDLFGVSVSLAVLGIAGAITFNMLRHP
jgi:hypothetical protein